MINLLAPTAKRSVKHQYLLRTATVWVWLLSGAVGVAIAFAVPVLVLIDLQASAASTQSADAADTQVAYKEAKAKLNGANALAKYLEGHDKGAPYLTYVDELESLAAAGITLSEFSMSGEGADMRVAVAGEATTRSALSTFVDSIESSEHFSKAKLPLGDLAEDRDIKFSITITPNIK